MGKLLVQIEKAVSQERLLEKSQFERILPPSEGGGCEVYVIPLETNRYLIYAPLRRTAFVTNAKGVNYVAARRAIPSSSEPDSDPALSELLRLLGLGERRPEQLPITRFSGDPRPTSVTLFLTTACNLRCTYCYASAGDTPLKVMSLETAQRGIDFVIANARQKREHLIKISYHGGGEPTANWAVLTQSFEYARCKAAEAGLGMTASSASNGVLRDEQIDWIVANLSGVSISFDGLPEVHDRHRLTVLGTGSSERVMHTLRRFDDADFAYGIRVTVTRDQIAQLADSIEFICTSFRPQRIQVEPAYQLGRWADAPSAETEQFIAAYREAQSRAALHGREISYSAVRLDALTNHFCGISQDSFALSPDGNVSACYEAFSEANPLADLFFYGRPDASDSGYVFEHAVLDHLRAQAVEHREYCQGCFAKWHCAGDCYHKSVATHGRGAFQGSDRCHITRELTKDQILARIATAGGLVWSDAIESRPASRSTAAEVAS